MSINNKIASTDGKLVARIYKDSDWDQFIIKHSDNENEWYYCDDIEDAIDTANYIINQYNNEV